MVKNRLKNPRRNNNADDDYSSLNEYFFPELLPVFPANQFPTDITPLLVRGDVVKR